MPWEIDGVAGRGERPPLVQTKTARRLLIAGPARCLFDDLAGLRALGDGPDETMAIKYACLGIPWAIEHIASLHGDLLPHFKALTQHLAGRPNPVTTHSALPSDPADAVWDLEQQRGTSSLFALQVAIAMGYRRILLAGVPLDSSGKFHSPPGALRDLERYGDLPREDVQIWRAAAGRWSDRVRSLSGRTAEWFGRPTAEWWAG